MNRSIVEIRRDGRATARHCHAYHQVLLPCAGTLEIEVEQQAGRVAGHVGAFVAAGRYHSCSAGPTDSYVALNVPIHPRLDSGGIPAFFAIGPDIRGLLDYMIALGSEDLLSPPLLSAWSSLVLDRLATDNGIPDRVEIGLRRAIAFMRLKFAEAISVGDVAEAAGMSPTRLHVAFQKRRSITPHAQLVALRLDAAERLLADAGLSIAEVALRTGHADQSALTRAMRRERGVTPGAVRQRLMRNMKGNA